MLQWFLGSFLCLATSQAVCSSVVKSTSTSTTMSITFLLASWAMAAWQSHAAGKRSSGFDRKQGYPLIQMLFSTAQNTVYCCGDWCQHWHGHDSWCGILGYPCLSCHPAGWLHHVWAGKTLAPEVDLQLHSGGKLPIPMDPHTSYASGMHPPYCWKPSFRSTCHWWTTTTGPFLFAEWNFSHSQTDPKPDECFPCWRANQRVRKKQSGDQGWFGNRLDQRPLCRGNWGGESLHDYVAVRKQVRPEDAPEILLKLTSMLDTSEAAVDELAVSAMKQKIAQKKASKDKTAEDDDDGPAPSGKKRPLVKPDGDPELPKAKAPKKGEHEDSLRRRNVKAPREFLQFFPLVDHCYFKWLTKNNRVTVEFQDKDRFLTGH